MRSPTEQECVEYQLPRAPIKDSDRSAPGFEQRYGEGATEIEALVECRPGELQRIVEQAVSLCRDEWLDDALDEAEDEAQAVLDQIEAEVHAEYADEIEQLKAEWDQIAEEIDSEEQQFRDQVEPILAELRVRVREFHDRLEPQFLSRLEGLHERAKALWHVIGEKLDDQAPAEFDWPEPEFEDIDEALYSRRGYLEQVDTFRIYSGLPLARAVLASGMAVHHDRPRIRLDNNIRSPCRPGRRQWRASPPRRGQGEPTGAFR